MDHIWTVAVWYGTIMFLGGMAVNQLRFEIKHNFLKKIMFRLDYEGIMESDVEKCIVSLRQRFHDAGFTKLSNRMENPFDLQVKMDLNIPNENQKSINNNIYSFSSNKREVLEISKSFFTLDVSVDQVYESFDKYMPLLVDTIEEIRSSSPYFQVLRISLRKINICLIDDLESLSEYFSGAAFNVTDVVKQFSDYGCSATNIVTVLSKNDYQVNYVRNVQEGVIQLNDGSQKTVYQAVIDVDVFKEGNKGILPLISDRQRVKETLETQNAIEFEVFIRSLSDKFIDTLKQEEFRDDAIRGVI